MENVIKKYRIKKGLSQRDFGKIYGTKQPNIFVWEKGNTDFRLTTMFKICECLDIPVEEFIAWQYQLYKENKK